MAKAMKEVIGKMQGRIEKIAEEENIEEGDEGKSVEAETEERVVSSPDVDEMADFGFGQLTQHDTAFIKASRKQVDKDVLQTSREQVFINV